MFRRHLGPPMAAMLAALSVLTATPAPTRAAAAEHFLDTQIRIPQVAVSSPAGTLRLGGHVTRDVPAFNLQFWPVGGDPETDPALLIDDSSRPVGVQLDGRVATLTVPMLQQDPDGHTQPIGDARVVVELAPNGDPVVVNETERAGNSRLRTVGWRQDIVASGHVWLRDGLSVPIDGIEGGLALLDTFRTNPDASVSHDRYADVFTALETPDAVLIVSGQYGDIHWGWLQVARIPFDPAESAVIGGFYISDLDPHAIDVRIPVEPFEGGPSIGEARLELRFRGTGARETYWGIVADARRRTVEEPLSGSGTLAFPGAPPADLEGIEGTFVTTDIMFRDPEGGRVGGPAPVNDLPDAAIDIVAGDAIANVWTGGASFQGEEGFPDSLAYTVWYRLQGTGEAITIDTSGSDYDTAMRLYARMGEDLVALEDADDLMSGRTPASATFQARMTFVSEPGVEYLVQAGSHGWDEREAPPEFGRLFLAVSGG